MSEDERERANAIVIEGDLEMKGICRSSKLRCVSLNLICLMLVQMNRAESVEPSGSSASRPFLCKA